eukprot:NODE_7431_length_591_cov_35.905172_g7408_i0.p2 GENE.NODE_7431_length_591_cov_35.905172_g7408_i0~~NODE_7431_length_591_cov_35.905172_g7408_i0.p2  ORF type:complete len:170 (+),score=64.25 NODE_7431_length_591_cov_35.905172_g7408_i0:50-511(+)
MRPLEYLLHAVHAIKPYNMPHTVALLTVEQCCNFLRLVQQLLEKPPPGCIPPTELFAKVLLVITKQHRHMFANNPTVLDTVFRVKQRLKAALKADLDNMGLSTAALQFMQRKAEEEHTAAFFNMSKRLGAKKPKRPRPEAEANTPRAKKPKQR